jgi:hypothetical protein
LLIMILERGEELEGLLLLLCEWESREGKLLILYFEGRKWIEFLLN